MRPSLTLSISTRDSAPRLGRLLAEARHYADEIVVGVDLGSADDTWDVAVAGADRVFGFRHTQGIAPNRIAGLERAGGDWVLFLDDDEGMDASFPVLRDELLAAPAITHWWLPRKCLASIDPPEHLLGELWYPDFSLRLVRADPTRFWKPPAVHSGVRMMGPGGREPRTAILHYDRVDREPAERAEKLRDYRARGQDEAAEGYYADAPDTPRTPVVPPPLRGVPAPLRPRPAARVDAGVDDLDLRPQLPGWAAEVEVEMATRARPGELLYVEARARNTGTLAWVPPGMTDGWPTLGLAYRLERDGELLPDASERAHVGAEVPPAGIAHFLGIVRVPAEPGAYVLHWQLVSEFEYWFTELGSAAARCPLAVVP